MNSSSGSTSDSSQLFLRRYRMYSRSCDSCDTESCDVLEETPYQTLREEEEEESAEVGHSSSSIMDVHQRLESLTRAIRSSSFGEPDEEPEPESDSEADDEAPHSRYAVEYDTTEVDISYGRIRPLRRVVPRTTQRRGNELNLVVRGRSMFPPLTIESIEEQDDEDFVRSERRQAAGSDGEATEDADTLRSSATSEELARDIQELRERHSETLRQLLELRSERFRMGNQQILSLLGLLREHRESLPADSFVLEHIREFYETIRLEVMVLLRRVLELDVDIADGEVMNRLSSIFAAAPADRQEEDDDDEFEGVSAEQLAQLHRREFCEEDTEELGHCTVCMIDFAPGDIGCSLTCGHFHHEECLHTWLRLKNSCPVCRVELPTDQTVSTQQLADFIAQEDMGLQADLL